MSNFVNDDLEELEQFVAANENYDKSTEGINLKLNEETLNHDLNFDLVDQLKKSLGKNVLISETTSQKSKSCENPLSCSCSQCSKLKPISEPQCSKQQTIPEPTQKQDCDVETVNVTIKKDEEICNHLNSGKRINFVIEVPSEMNCSNCRVIICFKTDEALRFLKKE